LRVNGQTYNLEYLVNNIQLGVEAWHNILEELRKLISKGQEMLKPDTNHINKDIWKRGTAETQNTYLKGGKEQNTTSQTSSQEKRDDSRCKKTGQEAHYFITCGINSGNAKTKIQLTEFAC
jgi:hypothetical protein